MSDDSQVFGDCSKKCYFSNCFSCRLSLFCWHLRYVRKKDMVRLGWMQFRIVGVVTFEAYG